MFTQDEIQEIAIVTIKNYLNKSIDTAYILDNYPMAVKRIVANVENTEKRNGVKSVSQGARSVTYNDSQTYITDDVKLLLPRPSIKML